MATRHYTGWEITAVCVIDGRRVRTLCATLYTHHGQTEETAREAAAKYAATCPDFTDFQVEPFARDEYSYDPIEAAERALAPRQSTEADAILDQAWRDGPGADAL